MSACPYKLKSHEVNTNTPCPLFLVSRFHVLGWLKAGVFSQELQVACSLAHLVKSLLQNSCALQLCSILHNRFMLSIFVRNFVEILLCCLSGGAVLVCHYWCERWAPVGVGIYCSLNLWADNNVPDSSHFPVGYSLPVCGLLFDALA